MRRFVRAVAVVLVLTAALAPAAQAQDSLAPRGAEPHWLPNEAWVNLRWLPYDEARLYRLLHTTRGAVFRWVRVDATNSLAAFARRRGWGRERLVRALIAPRAGKVSPATLRRLADHTRRTLTQPHLGQHILFHDLHQTAIQDHARQIFGVRSTREFFLLRRAELSPLQIGELHDRSRVAMRRGVERVLLAAQQRGVRLGQTTRAQADAQLERQLRQVPRWLGQTRYNAPTGGKNAPRLPPGDLAKHPTISDDGGTVVWDAYRTVIRLAEELGEIRVAGRHLGPGHAFAVSPPVRRGSHKPFSAYNAVLAAGGRYVAFETAQTTYPLAKRVGQMSVLRRDLRSGRLDKVSHAGRGPDAPTRTAFNPTISADGRLVAYEAADNGAQNGLFVRDMATGDERLLAEHGDRGAAFLPRLSPDGRVVAYTEAAADGRTLVRLLPLEGGVPTLVSRADGADGAVADSDAYEPALSADGAVVAFTSRAANLGRPAARSRVWVRDLGTGRTEPVSEGAPGQASQPAVSADGRYVAFVARLRFRSASVRGLRARVYLFDRATGRTALVSRRTGARGGPADGYSSEPAVSADGRRVVFTSTAGNLAARKPRGLAGVFVRDLASGTTRLLSSLGARMPRGGSHHGH